MNDAAFLVPSFNAGSLLAVVLAELESALLEQGKSPGGRVWVVDDGSTDGSADALPPWANRLTHPTNLGKGRALRTGFQALVEAGFRTAVTLDADAQHPAREALRLAGHRAPEGALVLGVRDLEGAGAPRPNRLSNRFSNVVLSAFAGVPLEDTQCGLRRYPLEGTLALGSTQDGYAFEADVVLRAARLGLPLVHVPVAVRYPTGAARISHFDAVRDPARIVRAVVGTALTVRRSRRALSPSL